MIIDSHTHLGGEGIVSASMDELLQEMQKAGVDRSVCFAMGENVEQQSFQLIEKAPSSIFSFFRFDPKRMTPKRLQLHLPQFAGVKLHPRIENFDPLDEHYGPLFKVIEKSEKPILIHTRKENNPYSDPDRLLELVKMYPKINFIYGHFATGVKSVIQAARDLDNLYLETSIVSSPKIIEMAVAICGAEKIIFGSDFPYSDMELEVQKIHRSNLTAKEKALILGENVLRLLRQA